jgi:YggT family protein
MQALIFIRAVISWLPVPRNNRLLILLHQITEPLLAPIRSLLNRSSFGRGMMFDISPIVALLLITFLKSVVLRLISPYPLIF